MFFEIALRVSAHQDDRVVSVFSRDPPRSLYAPQAGHNHIHKGEGYLFIFYFLERGLAAIGNYGVVTGKLQRLGERAPDIFRVVNDQDYRFSINCLTLLPPPEFNGVLFGAVGRAVVHGVAFRHH